jgi:hypothetical protein
MKFQYSTQEGTPYNFRKLGATLNDDMTVTLNDAAYTRFVEETQNTTHTLQLTKKFGGKGER